MISKHITNKQDFNDPEYRNWIKRIPVYLFALIWYFFIVGAIFTNIVLPLIRQNINTISSENSAVAIIERVAADSEQNALSIGFLDKNLFDSLEIINKNEIITSFENKTETTTVINLGVYNYNASDLVVLVSVKSPLVEMLNIDDDSQSGDEDSTKIINKALLDQLFFDENALTHWETGDKARVYYKYEDFGIESRFESSVFVNTHAEAYFYVSLYNLLIYVLYALPLLFLFTPKFKEDWHTLKREHSDNPIGNRIINTLALMMIFSVGLNLLTMLLKGMLDLPVVSANQATINLILGSEGKWFMVLSAVFIGPFVEEVIFRKVLFGLIRNDNLAIIISGLLFGLVHVTSESSFLLLMINFTSYGGMGFFLGYLYKKNNHNLLILYIIHALSNLLSVIG